MPDRDANPRGRRLAELCGLLMIGDGLMGTLFPRRYAAFWRFGPRLWIEADDYLAARPHLIRALGAAEAGPGLWLAFRQLPRVPGTTTPFD